MFSSRTLFGSGVKNLLDREPALMVIGWETDIEDAVKQIEKLQPDAILVITKDPSDLTMSVGQRLLKAGGKAKLVELNLEDSNVCVYSGEYFAIREISDLVRAIGEESTPVPVPTDFGQEKNG